MGAVFVFFHLFIQTKGCSDVGALVFLNKTTSFEIIVEIPKRYYFNN